MTERGWGIFPEKLEPPKPVIALAEQIEKDGGRTLAAYRDPLGDHWQVFALLPTEKVEPTPYQRDLSKTHADRLREVIKKLDRFIDPVVAVSPRPGLYWTPNGNHRRAALEKLKADFVPAIVIPEPEVAFQILALNTEKAHNLKEKSLEVIRMYRGLREDRETRDESEEKFTFQFEMPQYITLGLLYEKMPRFAGGAFAPMLRRVDKFLKHSLMKAYEEREHRASLVEAANTVLDNVVKRIKKRGINHPFVKSFVLARTTPLTRARKTLPSFETCFEKLRANLEKFDPDAVRYDEIARVAIFSAPAAEP